MIENSAQQHFNNMVSLQANQLRLGAIKGLLEVINEVSISKSMSNAAFAVISVMLDQLSSTQSHSLASFGLEKVLQTRLIGDNANVEIASILSSEPECYPVPAPMSEILKMLLVVLAGRDQKDLKTMIVETLCSLIEYEEQLLEEKSSTGPFRVAAAIALNNLEQDEILRLVSSIYPMSVSYEAGISRSTVKLLIHLAATQDDTIADQGYKIILNDLTENINQWASYPTQSMLTNLCCILASRFGTLSSIISQLLPLSLKKDCSPDLTDCIQNFFQFVVSLRDVAYQGSPVEALAESSSQGQRSSNRGTRRRTCTFTQTGEGFAEQHWYNCYTCGLLWDKVSWKKHMFSCYLSHILSSVLQGCCSLCARVCHKDHDVGYSRKSSFFCDCGAEVASGARQKCKCLSPIDDATFNALNNESNPIEEPKKQDFQNPAELVHLSFPAECIRTLQVLTKEAKACKWNETILTLLNRSFKTNPTTFNISSLYEEGRATISTTENGSKKPALDLRCGVSLNLQLLDAGPSMIPVRASKANSIKISMMSSSVHMRRNRSGRNLIEADTRGRMVCAESNSLSFFTAIPLINTRHMDTPYSSHLSRSQLCFLGSEKMKFEVQGLSLSENENLLVVWGSSDACVVVLSKGFDKIEHTIALELPSESESGECESEYLLRFLWLTETILVGICGTVIHTFDLATTNSEDTCKATAHFALAYEDVLIRSAVLTSNLSHDSHTVHRKLVILLDSGRIHFVDLFVDSDGALEEEGESATVTCFFESK